MREFILHLLLLEKKSTTTLFSNLGRLAIPDELKQYITKAVLFTGTGILNGARVAAISHGKDLAITFVSCYVDRTIERDFSANLFLEAYMSELNPIWNDL